MLQYEDLVKSINILMVDDDEDYTNIAYTYLKSKGYNLEVVNNGKDAIKMVKQDRHHIVLLDYFMPGMTGEEVVAAVREFNKNIIIILQTGFAGQKPPTETLKKLNIQNYHDKTEGLDKLHLELISAVKVFSQQNEVSISKYKVNAIGNLITSIAANMKNNLMSYSATLELINMLKNDLSTEVNVKIIDKLNDYYENSKKGIEKIDKVLEVMLKRPNEDDDIMTDDEIISIIDLIISNEVKRKSVSLNTKISLREKSYIKGITDVIFLICEIIFRIINKSEEGDKINLTLTEDDTNWYFIIESETIAALSKNRIYVFKNITSLYIKNSSIETEDNKITIALKK